MDVRLAASEGQALLANIGLNGKGNYLNGKQNQELAANAHEFAGILDAYDNKLLCEAP